MCKYIYVYVSADVRIDLELPARSSGACLDRGPVLVLWASHKSRQTILGSVKGFDLSYHIMDTI